MFEKEAEKAIMKKYPSSVQGYKNHITDWKDGAEFGYNFAKEEIDYLNKHWESKEERKADEWHYPSKGDFPKSEGSYYVAMDNGRGYKSGAILNWVEETDCEEDFHWEDDDDYECFDEQVYAWKECPVLPPKEN